MIEARSNVRRACDNLTIYSNNQATKIRWEWRKHGVQSFQRTATWRSIEIDRLEEQLGSNAEGNTPAVILV